MGKIEHFVNIIIREYNLLCLNSADFVDISVYSIFSKHTHLFDLPFISCQGLIPIAFYDKSIDEQFIANWNQVLDTFQAV